MNDPESPPGFPDEVPVADAVEQTRPTLEPEDPPAPGEGETAPLESSESDWQEQHNVIEGFDDDEFR